MNSSIKRPTSNLSQKENTRIGSKRKTSHSPTTAWLATKKAKPNAVYSESNNPLMLYCRQQLPAWKHLRPPQKSIITHAALLELQTSGYDALKITFHLSEYHRNLARQKGKMQESIGKHIKDCIRKIAFAGATKECYLWFILEDPNGVPHGHGAFLVRSDWRVKDREIAIKELEAGIEKAVCNDYTRRYKNKPVDIGSSFLRAGAVKPINTGWGWYTVKENPKYIYVSQELTPHARSYHENIRNTTTTNID